MSDPYNFAYRGPGENLVRLDGPHVWNCASWNHGQECDCPEPEPTRQLTTAERLDRMDTEEVEQ